MIGRQRVFIIQVLCLATAGCLSMEPVREKYDNRKCDPGEMEWLVTKLQANARVPWGLEGNSYSIDYKQGQIEGEIIAEVFYVATGDAAKDDALYRSVLRNITRAKNLLSAEYRPSDYGVRSKLHVTIRPVTMGLKLNQLEDIGKEAEMGKGSVL